MPSITHVHGQESVYDWADGYTEAWTLPAANNLAGFTPVSSNKRVNKCLLAVWLAGWVFACWLVWVLSTMCSLALHQLLQSTSLFLSPGLM